MIRDVYIINNMWEICKLKKSSIQQACIFILARVGLFVCEKAGEILRSPYFCNRSVSVTG